MPVSLDPAPKPRRRSPLRMFAPAIAFLVLAALWSGFWLFAARKADEAVAAALLGEAAKGRVITCRERSTGGYPFRLEIRCLDPHGEVTRPEGVVTVAARSFVAVAQAYAPNHVVAEIEGPLHAESQPDGRVLDATWTTAQASLVASTAGPQRVALVVDGLDAAATVEGQRRPLVGGAHLETHLRVAEGARAAPGAYDVAVSLDATSVPDVDARLGDAVPLKASVQGTVTGLLDLAPRPLPQRLRAWQAAGGVLYLTASRLDRGPTSVAAAGDVRLDAEGRPEGRLAVTIAGVKELAQALKRSGLAPANLGPLLGVGLTFLGKPSSIDGRAAVEVPVTMGDGRAVIGSLPVGSLPKFFDNEVQGALAP